MPTSDTRTFVLVPLPTLHSVYAMLPLHFWILVVTCSFGVVASYHCVIIVLYRASLGSELADSLTRIGAKSSGEILSAKHVPVAPSCLCSRS